MTAAVIDATRRWLELAVVGLNLCPFAKPVLRDKRIRYVVSEATSAKALRQDLAAELQRLAGASLEELETTLLIHPSALQDFYAFNDFLSEADAVLEDLDLAGTLQIASFHPRYQFADTDPDDIENATNRSPFPTLHLLREASIERAVRSMDDPDAIYQRNIGTMRTLGPEGWARLQARFEAVENEPNDRNAADGSSDPARDDRSV